MSRFMLPTEVLPHVFEELGHSDLRAVSLVSRGFRPEGQRIIFRHAGPLVLGPDVQSMGARFLDVIVNSPHCLALPVRSLQLQLQLFQIPERHIVTLARKLERALVLLSNLKTLRIWGSMTPLPHPLNPIMQTLIKCSFQLHTFEWEFEGGDELLVATFIRQQHGITDLTFTGAWRLAHKSSSPLRGLGRQLESLCADMSVASTIMSGTDLSKGSPLKYLRCTDRDLLHGFRYTDPPSTADLSSSFGGVRVLHYDYDATFVRPSLINMANSLQKVTLLRFQIRNLRDIGQEYYDALRRLPTLRNLILRMPHIYNYDILDIVAENVFSSCPNLLYMDVQSESEGSSTERYTPGETECQSQTLTSNEEEYSWTRRHHFIIDDF